MTKEEYYNLQFGDVVIFKLDGSWAKIKIIESYNFLTKEVIGKVIETSDSSKTDMFKEWPFTNMHIRCYKLITKGNAIGNMEFFRIK